VLLPRIWGKKNFTRRGHKFNANTIAAELNGVKVSALEAHQRDYPVKAKL
jgi:predicted nucleotidyltransferase